MPAHKKEITLGGHRFILHRLCGFEAAGAHFDLVGVCGHDTVPLLMQGPDGLTQVGANGIERSGETVLTMAMLLGALRQRRVERDSFGLLCKAFVLGHVSIYPPGEDDAGKPHRPVLLETAEQLDGFLDGSDDANVWASLLWKAVIYSVGPITADTGTRSDSPVTA